MKSFFFACLLLAALFPAHQVFAQQSIDFSGELTNDVTFNRPTEDCDALSGVETGYSTWTVSTVADFGRYTITSQQSGFDGFLFIYQSPFDPSDPLSNCLAANDDEEGDVSRSRIEDLLLFPDIEYTIVMAGFGGDDVGSYRNIFTFPNVTRFDGSTTGQNLFDRQLQDCSGVSDVGESIPFSAQPFTVASNGDYTIAQSQFDYDGYLHVYDDRFNPLHSGLGCLDGDDDGVGGIGESQVFDVRLAAGHTYYVVSSGFESTESGDFSASITGPGQIDLEEGEFSLARLSGIWYDPALDGSGFNVVARREGIIFTFFGYIEGVQRWLISELVPSEITKGETYEAVMYIGETGTLAAPSPGNGLPVFGTLFFSFAGCRDASATLLGSGSYVGLEQDYELALLLQAAGLDCPQ